MCDKYVMYKYCGEIKCYMCVICVICDVSVICDVVMHNSNNSIIKMLHEYIKTLNNIIEVL